MKTCVDCEYYDYEIIEDSFGPMREEYCSKGHYGHVGWYSEPCKEFKFVPGENLCDKGD